MFDVWFWQSIVSPHMAHLCEELVKMGCKVTYVAERTITSDRVDLGWSSLELQGVKLECASGVGAMLQLVESSTQDSIHVCQGIRANESIGAAQRAMAARGLRQWIVMETVEDSGWRGFVKRFEYSRLFWLRLSSLQGVLTIGHRTAGWVAARGVRSDRIYRFAYFLLDEKMPLVVDSRRKPGPFRLIFVGQLISRKRVDRLVNALSELTYYPFELCIVGSGAEEPALRLLAESKLGSRVRWLGTLPLPEVTAVMLQADCLVLPSAHDGWGAVISEALMVGTPVICSDACGAAGVVKASGFGGVFCCDNGDELQVMLEEQLKSGPVNKESRKGLASWAVALGAEKGARYLINIFDYIANGGSRPMPPWEKSGDEKCVE